jgi:hypothetical protein
MKAVPVVVDTVTFPQLVVDTIEGKIKRSLFDYHVLARTLSVGKKGAGINAGIQSRSHEFEFNAWQHRREDSPLPPRRIPSHRLIFGSQDVNTGFHFRGEETRKTGFESRCDPVQNEDGRRFGTAFDCGNHAPADSRSLAQDFQRYTAVSPFGANAVSKYHEVQCCLRFGCGSHFTVFYYRRCKCTKENRGLANERLHDRVVLIETGSA